MDFNQFKDNVVPKILAELGGVEPDPATDTKSSMRKASITIDGMTFSVLDQNTKKDSRFAKLAKNGHSVAWIIREMDNQWFLIVDGKLTPKANVTDDGQLKEVAA